jgi:ABC-type uncharacterized transport system permease subunit
MSIGSVSGLECLIILMIVGVAAAVAFRAGYFRGRRR